MYLLDIFFVFVLQCLIVAFMVTMKTFATEDPISLVLRLIQNNLVGGPVVHEVTEWEFDPDVAVRRREIFQQVNGFRGEKLIERIGLGTDGLHNVRLAIQRERDEGLLGGTIHKIKSGDNIVQY